MHFMRRPDKEITIFFATQYVHNVSLRYLIDIVRVFNTDFYNGEMNYLYNVLYMVFSFFIISSNKFDQRKKRSFSLGMTTG